MKPLHDRRKHKQFKRNQEAMNIIIFVIVMSGISILLAELAGRAL